LKILLFGKNGQLGKSIAEVLRSKNIDFVALSRDDIDITDHKALKKSFNEHKPNICINAVAYTDVDQSEINTTYADRVNNLAVSEIAKNCSDFGSRLIHFSTDYVFDGTKDTPYTEKDKPNPLNHYGVSKLEGEKAIETSGCSFTIIRTSWVFSEYRKNFLKTILNISKNAERITVVHDQHGCPTYAKDISKVVFQLISNKRFLNSESKIYHFCGNKCMSWYEFASHIVKAAHDNGYIGNVVVDPVQSKNIIDNKPNRPKYSALSPKRIIKDFDLEFSDTILAINKTVKNIIYLS